MEIRNSGQNKQTGATLSVSPRQNNGSEMTHRKCPFQQLETQDPMQDTKLWFGTEWS